MIHASLYRDKIDLKVFPSTRVEQYSSAFRGKVNICTLRRFRQLQWCGFFPKEVKARDPRIVDENSLTVMDRQFKVTYFYILLLAADSFRYFPTWVFFRKLFKLILCTGKQSLNFIKKKTNRSTTIKLS